MFLSGFLSLWTLNLFLFWFKINIIILEQTQTEKKRKKIKDFFFDLVITMTTARIFFSFNLPQSLSLSLSRFDFHYLRKFISFESIFYRFLFLFLQNSKWINQKRRRRNLWRFNSMFGLKCVTNVSLCVCDPFLVRFYFHLISSSTTTVTDQSYVMKKFSYSSFK